MWDFIKKYTEIIFFTIIVILILNPYIFQNGYFLSIDYISWPEIKFIDWQYYPNYILWMYIQKFFALFLGNIITQKIFIIGLFFTWYFSIKKLLQNFSSDRIIIFVGILFFIFNPFVYPRLLQGQFYILYAYMILPLFFHFLYNKKYLQTFIISAIILAFSPHFIFILGIIFIFYIIYFFKDFKENIKIKELIFWIIFIFIFNSYWIFNITSNTNILNFWNDFYNFASKSIYFSNIYLEIFSLNWFWWDQYWRYIINKNNINYLYIITLFSIVLVWFILLNKENKKFFYFFISIFIVSFIFSIWISENNIFSKINLFFYENIPFYKWLREANKFSAIIVIVYLILIIKSLESINDKNKVIIISFIILFSTWNNSLIFFEQIKWYKYPETWFEIKNIIKDKKNLSLPWHQSMSFKFIDNKNVTNPSWLFFWENTIVWDNIEIWDIYSQSTRKESIILEKYFKNITSKDLNKNNFFKDIKSIKIEYIILFKEIDYINYKIFLDKLVESKKIEKIIENKEIILYKIFT